MLKVSPKVERDDAFKAQIFQALKARYEEERVGIHATDNGVMETYNVRYSNEALREISSFEVKMRGEILTAIRSKDPLKASYVAGHPELDWKCLTCQYWEKCSGRRTAFKTVFPEPLLVNGPFERLVLREALKASGHGCNVKTLRDAAGAVTGVEASGDVVKLVPLRRAVDYIARKMTCHENGEPSETRGG